MPTHADSPARHSPDTPWAFVQAILQAYAQRGISATGALLKAQITPDQQARRQCSAQQFERLCAAAMQELDDEAPGWFSRRLPWGSYGMLARASHHAPSLGIALKRWCRHHGLLTDDVLLRLDVQDNVASLCIVEAHPLPAALREFALLSLLRNVHGLACWWIDSGIALYLASLPYPAPAHARVYESLFPGPVRFDAGQAALHFDAHYLAQPLRRDNAALDSMLRRALPLMVWPYKRDRLLALRVRQQLQQDLSLTAAALAERLHISTRSLHRQLAAEGTHWQTLKDQARLSHARDLLLRSAHPLRHIARSVGFASDKTFVRAFRHWTGQSPDQWRRQAASGDQLLL